jgi:DNA-binding HxlR family transcriptional regulator
VVARRWVPLILREIMVGYRRFDEIRRALPLISPSVLVQRLKTLVDLPMGGAELGTRCGNG